VQLQDQALAIMFYNMTPAAAADPTRGALPQMQGNLAFPNLAQLFGTSAAATMVAALNASAGARAAAIVRAGGHTSVAGLTRQFEVQVGQIAGGGT
jgi:choline dehydrogenase